MLTRLQVPSVQCGRLTHREAKDQREECRTQYGKAWLKHTVGAQCVPAEPESKGEVVFMDADDAVREPPANLILNAKAWFPPLQKENQ